MKVILNQTVPKVGKEGSVVNVADGYARNYLFPRNLAIYADRKQIAALEKRNERIAAKTAGEKSAAEGLKEKLDGKEIKIEGKVGEVKGKLFGAVTSQNIVDTIKEQLKVDVDKKNVALIEPIKRLGHHKIQIDLHREVDAFVSLHVFDPNAPEEEEEEKKEEEQKVEAAQAEAPAAETEVAAAEATATAETSEGSKEEENKETADT